MNSGPYVIIRSKSNSPRAVPHRGPTERKYRKYVYERIFSLRLPPITTIIIITFFNITHRIIKDYHTPSPPPNN